MSAPIVPVPVPVPVPVVRTRNLRKPAAEKGEFSKKDKARFYRMALRSATECAALLDVCRKVKVSDEAMLAAGRDLLLRIVSMLTKMAKVLGEKPGTGTGTGTGTIGNTAPVAARPPALPPDE